MAIKKQMLQLGPSSEWEKDEFSPFLAWTREPEFPRCDLHTLASIGNTVGLQEFLERERTSVSKKNKEGWTPLMYACFNGCPETIELLLRCGAEKDTRNAQGQTALMIAAHNGHEDAAKFFTEKAVVNAADDKGWTALFYAVNRAHQSVANILLLNGADINKVDKTGATAAMVAAMEGKEGMVKFILKSGADATIKSLEGETLKSIATRRGLSSLAQVVDLYLPEEPAKEVGVGRKVKTKEPWQPQPQPLRKSRSLPPVAAAPIGCVTNHVLQIALKEMNLLSILKFYSLEKYHKVFENQNIDLGVFLSLTEEDLRHLGIELFGPRRKLSLVIKHLNRCDICHLVTQQQYLDSVKTEFGNVVPKLCPSD
ncbi:ankyrin repeat and SAM domain-containing protein 3-like isoform X2 [Ischnura elegans]|uniref:ankyrin repeat and SAM domain-containing protein 3-like isoform X2 n=1 Tax=Ischnura elegans TaxID=197161 RepID=UPI001ED8B1F9|nr:ankyrin repeat and SAM domain-containing protein 3-like isoform X2 [Ischnura elegans]